MKKTGKDELKSLLLRGTSDKEIDNLAAEHFRNLQRLRLQADLAEAIKMRKSIEAAVRKMKKTERKWTRQLRKAK